MEGRLGEGPESRSLGSVHLSKYEQSERSSCDSPRTSCTNSQLHQNDLYKTIAAMHGLQLPRPANPSSLPPLDPSSSSSSAPPSRTPRAPPPSFAAARVQARQMRGEGKSPFVPRSKTGKERDLSTLSVEQLSDMFERNARLLEHPYVLLRRQSSVSCPDEPRRAAKPFPPSPAVTPSYVPNSSASLPACKN